MKKRLLKNVAASVRQRLLAKAKERDRPFNELLQFYAIERFIYRLSRTRHVDRFILKGALMFQVWKAPHSRPTKDIDFLGQMRNDIASISEIIKEVCVQEVEPDGISFDPTSVQGTGIAQDAEYEGMRIRFCGHLETARVAMQIDIGFGDVVTQMLTHIDYPTLLDFPAPKLRGYSRESCIAEKFHVMVKRGELNSRMKDFYDIWLLSQTFDFDGAILGDAIQRTFQNRDTEIVGGPLALQASVGEAALKETQWRAFIKKSKIQKAPATFAEVVEKISGFLGPMTEALSQTQMPLGKWKIGGPWT